LILIVFIKNSNRTGARAVVNTAITRLKRHTGGSYITTVNSSQEMLEFGKSFPDYKKYFHQQKLNRIHPINPTFLNYEVCRVFRCKKKKYDGMAGHVKV
jgi:hypothetical protein